jgi:5-methylcytosine-specific restriction protein B
MSLGRVREPGVERVYDAAEWWVDRCLRRDGSLFDEARRTATVETVDGLYAAFVERPDLGKERFLVKLQGQLADQSADVVQLAAELLYFHLLITSPQTMSGERKRETITTVLGFVPGTSPMPAELATALDVGLVHPGQAYLANRDRQFAWLIEFLRRWKRLDPTERDELLADAWRFGDWVYQLPEKSAFTQRFALLHLVFPDTYPPVVSRDHRERILQRWPEAITDNTVSEDRQLRQLDDFLQREYGKDYDLYRPPVVRQWRPRSERWKQWTGWAKRFAEAVDLHQVERSYKLGLADELRAAREAVLAEESDWFDQVRRAFTRSENNLVALQASDLFLKWCQGNPADAKAALKGLWESDEPSLANLERFLTVLPADAPSGRGARLSIASYLLMGLDATAYPIYRAEPLTSAYRLTGFGKPAPDPSGRQEYEHALEFLDQVLDDAAADGLELQDRLDAQGLAWTVVKADPPQSWPERDRDAFLAWREGTSSPPTQRPAVKDPQMVEPPPAADQAARESLAALAGRLYLDEPFVTKVIALLRDKGQLILYGPPGTGKTYLALELATYLARDPGRTGLVQFHPSYAYEDFVEGLRPREGDAGFRLVDGPLKRMAEQARAHPEHTYVLVIDELNRGNVAKVLGELYFLLEYRERQIELLYSSEPFSFPTNLLLIGTMNSADRSIALLDSALRRRFYFVPLFPDRPPIQQLLRRYLQHTNPGMLWVADVVDAANSQLSDPATAIGPSHFLRKDLDETWARTTWEYAVLPTLEDHFYGQPTRLDDFEFDALRASISAQPAPEPTDAAAPPAN